MELTKKQEEAIRSKARYKVLNWGRRSGKTTEFAYEALGTALTINNAKISYYAQTFGDARDIAWDIFLSVFGETVINKNETLLEITVKNLKGGTSLVRLKGWESVVTSNKGRGTENHLLLLDEVAFCRGFVEYWEKVLDPTLLTTKGRAVFGSTPNGFNHFHDLADRARENKTGEWFYSHATSYDNPFNDPKWLENKKKEITEDRFSQEYLADFRKTEGLVYKEFLRELHVIDPINIPDFWQHYGAMDFGAVNPTVYLWIAVDNNDTVYVVDEYYSVGQTKGHADFILAKTRILKYNVLTTWCDPSGEQEQLDYASFGLYATPAVKIFNGQGQSWVNYGIGKISELLKPNPQTGRPRLYIFKNCVNLIKEFESYRWKDYKEGMNAVEVPEKVDDHGPDALRYFVVSNENKNYRQYEEHLPLKTNNYTGYGRRQ